jgi:hypothetical protein
MPQMQSPLQLIFSDDSLIAMARTVWLALTCLIAVTVLFAVRTTTVVRYLPAATASIADKARAPVVQEAPPLAKADRLPFRFPATPPATVSATEIATTPDTEKLEPAASVSEPAKLTHEVTSWHWHAGSKITKRTTVVGER